MRAQETFAVLCMAESFVARPPIERAVNRIGAAVLCAVWLCSVALVGGRAEAPVRSGGPRVRVEQGVLAGKRFGVSGGEFLGVPFAEAPVGRLRWVAPEEPQAWAGVRDATHARAACPQLPSKWLPEMLGIEEMETSEDCLYLNVWTPRLNARAKLPVMVWVHGGGNVEGAPNWPPLGEALAAHGVVVVTINYRLGVLGFPGASGVERGVRGSCVRELRVAGSNGGTPVGETEYRAVRR